MFIISNIVFAQDLSIKVSDIRISKDEKSGYHLFVRQKPGIESVLLTETVKDPENKSSSYAYRSKEWNSINGDEKRLLDGKELVSEYSKFSIIDSTPENDKEMGNVFHLYIPEQMIYGNPWSRSGEVTIQKGTFINIRTFEKEYADYTGNYLDNPFMFNFKEVKKEVAKEITKEVENKNPVLYDDYSSLAAESFKEIADLHDGKIIYSRGPDTIVDDIVESLLQINPKQRVDVVFAIDATGSMKDDIELLRKKLVPRLESEFINFGDVRLGLLLYRDYGDNYYYKNLPVKYYPFTIIPDEFYKQLNGFTITGREGGDVPEAVYEALYASIEFYEWDPKAQKKIILIGDAEPHSRPRGKKLKCTKELIQELAQKKGIIIDTIITPDKMK